MRLLYPAVIAASLLAALVASWTPEPGIPGAALASDFGPACDSGAAVENPADNPGLVSDCAALLQAEEVLAGGAELNWDAGTPIAEWDGVTIGSPAGGGPGRVWKLELHSRGLSGSIPPQLGSLAGLRDLRLDGNELTGSIPPELGNIGDLFYLRLDRNRLTGPIPAELGRLGNLWSVQLDGNELTGSIPPELGGLGRLWYLWLGENELTGEIPAELGDLRRIRGLSLSDNDLTGRIPAELGEPPRLWILRLGGNSLAGCVPESVGDVGDTDLESLGLPSCDELPHLADDVAEPIITTSGTPSPAIVATVRTEVERLQSFFRDRLGAGGAAYTIRIVDGEMDEESARLLHGFVLSCPTRTLTQRPPPLVVVLDASCDADMLAFALMRMHYAVLTPRVYYETMPHWLETGIGSYTSYHYAQVSSVRAPNMTGGASPADARRSGRTNIPLREMETLDGWLAASDRGATFLPFLAVEWLAEHAGEPSLFAYWRAYAEDHSDWRRAFETAFGLTPDAFYAVFERYRATLWNPGPPPPADDAAEPVITTSGTPSAAIVATVRTEVERLQSFFRDRFKAGGADYTLRIADGETYEESARLLFGEVGRCRTRAPFPPVRAVVLDASCDAVTLAYLLVDDHYASLTPGVYYQTMPEWLESGIGSYTSYHYAQVSSIEDPRMAGGESPAAARRSGRTNIPLREMETLDGSIAARDRGANFLPFLAVEWLAGHAGEPSLFVYWRAYAEDPYYWRHAFETAFGLTLDAFYAAFERYRAILR